MTKTKNKIKNRRIITFCIILILFIAMVAVIGQYLFDNHVINSDRFYDNTRINGINVSGMTKEEAANVVSTNLISTRDDVNITLKYNEKNWDWNGSDFEINNDIFPMIESAFKYGRSGSFSEKISTAKKIKQHGFDVDISYKYVLGGIDTKIDKLISEIEIEAQEPVVTFNPNLEVMFSVSQEQNGIRVDKEKLYDMIDEALSSSKDIAVEIPTFAVLPEKKKEDVIKNLKLRSKFETSYAGSAYPRKYNVGKALKDFNGLVVMPEEEISFNIVTGCKNEANGYMKANIILNGVYVEGAGGGVCQSSTTLYNALLLSDIEILEVNSHSLPVSYVPLGLDAMVYEGSSDLRFKNNLNNPIYIKTYTDDNNAYVEIYGEPLEDSLTIKTRSEFVKSIPHNGDRIVKDEKGEYSNKITFIGEYMRLKYPQEGCRAKGIIEYYKGNEKIDEKIIRDEIYNPQQGIIIEGTEILGEGMTLPENNVKIIPSQKSNNQTENILSKKYETNNPVKYNP